MKKLFLVLFALQFSLFCYSQTDNIHHYTDQEVIKLSTYISDLEKKVSTISDSAVGSDNKKQIAELLNDSSHNYYDEDIIKIFKYIKDLEKKVAFNNMLKDIDDTSARPILLVKGTVIFEDAEPQSNYSIVSITVKDKISSQLIGIYTPNPKTGKYLLILDPGEKYLITAITKGYQMYSKDFSPETKKGSYEMTQEIKLKKE